LEHAAGDGFAANAPDFELRWNSAAIEVAKGQVSVSDNPQRCPNLRTVQVAPGADGEGAVDGHDPDTGCV
jgi:hypothetical protein